jgi:uncharacterized protein YukE
MSTSPSTSDPTEGQIYAAYQSTLDALNAACEATSDPDVVMSLNNAAQAVSDVLSGDNEVALEANTAVFTALTAEMKKANDALKKLNDQLATVATTIGNVGKVLAAIGLVLELTKKFM